ncbi:MAG: NB-ARC domain-containing protein [Ardenticatenaceae bacterium]
MSSDNQTKIDKITENVKTALRNWHKNLDNNHLDDFSLFHKLQREGLSSREATTQLLSEGLNAVQKKNAKQAKLLRQRFVDCQQVNQLSLEYLISDTMIYKLQKKSITSLAEELLEMDDVLNQERIELMNKRLPPLNTLHVIGLEEHINDLKEELVKPEAPWVMLLAGLGGIGKTTLANTLVRHLIPQGLFDDFGWVSAKSTSITLIGGVNPINEPALTVEALLEELVVQLMGDVFKQKQLSRDEAFSTLKGHLKEKPHLIVIDNLETVLDLKTLLPTLRTLANPSKFLLTSRESLPQYADIYDYPVPGLSDSNGLQLIRQEARIRNLPHLANANDENLIPIYETVGGNPLALRLVVGQAYFQPINIILSDFVEARGKPIANFYDYIYRRAWDNMEETTRRLFLFMPLVTGYGADLDHIAAVTNFDPSDLRSALQDLIKMNLVDASRGLKEWRYSIHNLTRTFLENGPIRWNPEKKSEQDS